MLIKYETEYANMLAISAQRIFFAFLDDQNIFKIAIKLHIQSKYTIKKAAKIKR